MTYKIKKNRFYCGACTIEVNGKEAKLAEFGEFEDVASDFAEPYGCGNMKFFPNDPSKETCQKYGISEKEFKEIASELAKTLSWGYCELCS